MAKEKVNKFKVAVAREMNEDVIDLASEPIETTVEPEPILEPVLYEIMSETIPEIIPEIVSDNIESSMKPPTKGKTVPKSQENISNGKKSMVAAKTDEFMAIKHLFQENIKPDYKNKTYYMRLDIIDIIKNISEEKNLSESYIVTELLKSALGIK